MAKEAQILFEFENSKNKLIYDRPIDYSDHYSDRYFNISMIQEIIDGVITNEADTYHLRSTYIKDIEFIWQKDISSYSNVYKHLKIYGDNSNFKIKYSSDDTNPLELPISNNEEFYLYKLGDPITLNVKCQDLWYKITVTDQNTLTYTTSNSSDFNLLPSPEKNNIVYKDDLDRYTYSKIKVGDNLKGKRLGLRNDEKAVNKFLYNITKDNYMHPVIRGKDGSNIAYENKTENSYIGFYIKYANNTSTYYSEGTVSFIGSGYRPSGQAIIECTEDFIVTSISAGWDDILMIIDEVPLLSTKEDKSNKVYTIDTNNTYTHYDYPNVNSVIEYVQNSINNTQETINIQKDSSITDEGIGKLDIASANIFTSTTEPHFYKVGVADTTLYNGILYNGTVPFKNVTDDSLVRIQKDAVIYYAGGVAYCFTGEGIYSLLWDDTEKKGWVTKVKMDNESYHVYDQEIDTLPNITVTAGDFTWDATAKTLTVKGAKNTTKTATIKFNEDVDGVYYSLANSSLTTGRMGMLSAKINNEDYYIGLLQGFGTHYSQWNMKKNDVVTIEYTGDSTATADDEFVFKIEHWQKPKQTTSVASYANYIVGNSELNDQMNESSLRTDVLNMKYDMDERHTHHYEAYRGNSLPTCTITNGTNGFSHPSNSVDFTATSADGMTYETTLTITQENMDAMGFLATITSSKESATWGECTLKIENTTQNRVLLETSEIGESRTIGGVNTGDSIKMTFTCPTSVNTPMEVTVSAIMYLTWETTSMVENVIHSVAAIEEFITDQKIDHLENELKHVKAEQKPQIHTGTYPNLQLNLNAASDNSEWRIWQGSQGNCTLTIGFDGSEIGEESTFGCTVVFKTPYRSTATTSFSWAADYGDMVSIVGDDVVDGVFTPQLLKVYEMVFTWNGFVMNCVVKGSKYTPPQE